MVVDGVGFYFRFFFPFLLRVRKRFGIGSSESVVFLFTCVRYSLDRFRCGNLLFFFYIQTAPFPLVARWSFRQCPSLPSSSSSSSSSSSFSDPDSSICTMALFLFIALVPCPPRRRCKFHYLIHSPLHSLLWFLSIRRCCSFFLFFPNFWFLFFFFIKKVLFTRSSTLSSPQLVAVEKKTTTSTRRDESERQQQQQQKQQQQQQAKQKNDNNNNCNTNSPRS